MPGRHADHGDHLRPAAFPLPADGGDPGGYRALLPRGAGRRRGAGALRLQPRQGPGNHRRAGPGRAGHGAPWRRPSHDRGRAHLAARFSAGRALQRRGGSRRKSAHLPAERKPFPDAAKDQKRAHRHALRLGDEPGRAFPVSDRHRVSAVRSCRLSRLAAPGGNRAAPARADAPWLRGRVCPRPARARDRVLGAQRGKPARPGVRRRRRNCFRARLPADGRAHRRAGRAGPRRAAARGVRSAPAAGRRFLPVCRRLRSHGGHHGQAQEDRVSRRLLPLARHRFPADRRALSRWPRLCPKRPARAQRRRLRGAPRPPGGQRRARSPLPRAERLPARPGRDDAHPARRTRRPRRPAAGLGLHPDGVPRAAHPSRPPHAGR